MLVLSLLGVSMQQGYSREQHGVSEGHFCVRLQEGAVAKAKDAVAKAARSDDARTIIK